MGQINQEKLVAKSLNEYKEEEHQNYAAEGGQAFETEEKDQDIKILPQGNS